MTKDVANAAKKKGVIKGFFGSLVDVRKWTDFDDIKSNARFIASSYRDLLPKKNQDGAGEGSKVAQTFDETVRLLQWSEEDIKEKTKYFFRYFIIYLISAIGLFFYTVYLLNVSNKTLAIFASLILAMVMLVYAWREHFWYMQMRQRKLGCTLSDWVSFVFKRAK